VLWCVFITTWWKDCHHLERFYGSYHDLINRRGIIKWSCICPNAE
jgi:hypothetical protein